MFIQENSLAIVIPAYKPDYFEQTLESISNQTNKRFVLYIGDDFSSNNLEQIVDKYRNRIDIIYFKFSTNLGSIDLVGHWKRCIDLTQNEKWIWLFSDDDIMESNCVENFYNAVDLTDSRFDLYRFNVNTIDNTGEILYKQIPNPRIESAVDSLIRKISFKSNSFIVEYVFSREVYNKYDGFVNFPSAWFADDATWALFGKDKGIFSIPNSIVEWRYSGSNISSIKTDALRIQKMAAVVQFINWSKSEFHFQVKDHLLIDFAISQSITNSCRETQIDYSIFYILFTQTQIKRVILLQKLFKSLLRTTKNQLLKIKS